MEVYNYITQKEISQVDEEIKRLQDMITTIDDKKLQLETIKPNNDRTQIKLNYTMKERRFDYGHIKTLEEADKPQIKVAKIGIDKNWLAANMEEPDILTFYDPDEYEAVMEDTSNADNDFDSKDPVENQFDTYLDSMQYYCDRVLEDNFN